MATYNIRRDDMVIAISGVSAGKTGKVLEIMPARGRAVVDGMNIQKKMIRKTQDNPQGGIGEKAGSMSISNVMLYCPDCKKGVRARRERNGKNTVRLCKLCGHAFDK